MKGREMMGEVLASRRETAVGVGSLIVLIDLVFLDGFLQTDLQLSCALLCCMNDDSIVFFSSFWARLHTESLYPKTTEKKQQNHPFVSLCACGRRFDYILPKVQLFHKSSGATGWFLRSVGFSRKKISVASSTFSSGRFSNKM